MANGITQINPEEEDVLEPAAGQEAPVGEVSVEGEPKLYAGRYKTPEELEEGYKNSSTEGKRLFAEVQRLTQLVKGTGAQPASQPKGKGYEDFFDKDTAEAIKWYIQNHITQFAQSQSSEVEYQRQVDGIWKDTVKECPDLNNQESELFQLADKILFERGLGAWNAKGKMELATPWAYKIAVDAAYAQLSKQAPAKLAAATRKGQATAISGRSTSGYVPTGRLTDDQYSKLSEDEKDAYDKWTTTQPRR